MKLICKCCNYEAPEEKQYMEICPICGAELIRYEEE